MQWTSSKASKLTRRPGQQLAEGAALEAFRGDEDHAQRAVDQSRFHIIPLLDGKADAARTHEAKLRGMDPARSRALMEGAFVELKHEAGGLDFFRIRKALTTLGSREGITNEDLE